MLVTTPFNPELASGNSVTINIYIPKRGSEIKELSHAFAGKWVVESCTHVWNGKQSRGFTKLIIGRKYVNVPNSYLLKEKLI
jgi:hypothetical protein